MLGVINLAIGVIVLFLAIALHSSDMVFGVLIGAGNIVWGFICLAIAWNQP